MITLDTLFIVIFAVLLIYGLCRGLISIIIPILAIIATFLIAPLIYNHMSKFFSHSAILKIISLIASYSIIRIILSKVEKSIKDILKVIYLSWVDRLLGTGTIMMIAIIITYFAVNMIIYIFPEYSDIINQSKIINYIFVLFQNDNYISNFINNFNNKSI
ncbi:CvpA family protein [Brachyspira pulli]|uniref:CvpA family protein n=1 Tax=Brachyspira pulli TaxID=310721 RepID=UPI00300795B0